MIFLTKTLPGNPRVFSIVIVKVHKSPFCKENCTLPNKALRISHIFHYEATSTLANKDCPQNLFFVSKSPVWTQAPYNLRVRVRVQVRGRGDQGRKVKEEGVPGFGLGFGGGQIQVMKGGGIASGSG